MIIPKDSTGKPMRVVYRPETMTFRGEKFNCAYMSFRDDELNEGFTTTESDSIWYNQVTNQYREKHGIPYQDEIIATRERYGVSASKMSLILGFGTNQYRLYEEGEVPSESNGKMIRSAMNPRVFQELVGASRNLLSEKEFVKISAKVEDVIEQSVDMKDDQWAERRIFRTGRGLANGFAPQSTARLRSLLVYVLGKMGDTFQTKMNKVLFYIDFLSYRERGMAISGLAYQAIEFGPVPQRWDRVYSGFDEVVPQSKMVKDQECTVLTTDVKADTSLFSKEELEIIDAVCKKLAGVSAKKIVEMSHLESAWKKYYNPSQSTLIPFEEAFSLVAF